MHCDLRSVLAGEHGFSNWQLVSENCTTDVLSDTSRYIHQICSEQWFYHIEIVRICEKESMFVTTSTMNPNIWLFSHKTFLQKIAILDKNNCALTWKLCPIHKSKHEMCEITWQQCSHHNSLNLMLCVCVPVCGGSDRLNRSLHTPSRNAAL